MNILVNAYACSPNMGSEPGMGWNWCVNLAHYCNLYIITEGEWKDEIENAITSNPFKDNLHFYYLPVTDRIRKICWNQGDWRFYWYYRQWQKRALRKAQEICLDINIDAVHQLNMVGFREPGYMWILGKPLVWGPIGGMGIVNNRFLEGAPLKMRIIIFLKNLITKYQIKYSPRVRKAINTANALIAAVPETQKSIEGYYKCKSLWIPETGCYDFNTISIDKRNRKDFHILWVGRFIFTKRLDIALRTIAEVKHLPNLHFHIVGSGSKKETANYKELCKNLGIDAICEWHGKVNNRDVHKMMREFDLFFFTSIAEATSTVVPEAINNALPILCFDTCGFGPIVTNQIGRKVEMTTPNQSIKDFANHIKMMYFNKSSLYEMSNNCKEALKSLLWDKKARKMVAIYNSLLQSKDNAETERS